MGVVKHWNSFPRQAVENTSVEMFRSCLDMVLSYSL